MELEPSSEFSSASIRPGSPRSGRGGEKTLSSQSVRPAPSPSTRVAAVVGFLVFIEIASGFIQGYYLPLFGAIAEHLSITDADIVWFTTLQTLSAAVCVPILAKLGDIFGHRFILRLGIIAVFVGVLLTALAPNYALVLVGRVLIGPLAVWLPLEIAIVHSRIQGESGRKAIGLLVSALTFGAVLGSIVGGQLGTKLEMTMALLVPAILVAVCIVLVFTLIPESTTRTRTKIDWLGFTLLAVGMIALLWSLRSAQGGQLLNPVTISCFVAAIVLIVAFVFWELRTPNPAINLRVVASPLLWPAYITSFLFGMVLFGTQTLTTTFLAGKPDIVGYGFGLEPNVISLFTAGSALLAVLGAALFAYVAKVITLRGVLVLGVILGALGSLALVFGWGSLAMVVISTCLSGLGGGLLLGALPALIAERSPSNETGIATGLYNTLKTLGGAAAGAVFAVLLAASFVPETGAASIGGYLTIWIVCAAMFALAALVLVVVKVQGAVTAAIDTVEVEELEDAERAN